MAYPELQLDIGLWQNKTDKERVQDFSSALLEFQRRPNIYWITAGQLKKVRETARTDHPIFQSEALALDETIKWLEQGMTQYSICINPSKEGFYLWPRAILSKRFEENGQARALNIAVCLPLAPQECSRLARAFVQHSPLAIDSSNPESLRSRPIHFNLPPEKDFQALVKILTLGINIQTLFAEKLQALEDADKILEQYHEAIRNSATRERQIFTGAQIEHQAIARGYLINQFRDCPGISNFEALKKLGSFDKVYFYSSAKDWDNKFTPGVCRICKADTLVGPCKICKPCEEKFDKGEMSSNS